MNAPLSATPRIEMWFDFASPYSYLAIERIDALARQADVQVDLRPFLLDNWHFAMGALMVVVGSSLFAYFTWNRHWLVRYTVLPVLLASFTATLAGLRRRGYTPESIKRIWDSIGIAKRDNTIELARLEFEIREELNKRAPRRMAVLRPIRLVIENYPEGREEHFQAANHPANPDLGTRPVPFAREIWIEAYSVEQAAGAAGAR